MPPHPTGNGDPIATRCHSGPASRAALHRCLRRKRLRAAAAKVAADPAVKQVIARAGSPIEYLDAPEFQTYWNADAAQMTKAVRAVGKVE